MPTANLARFCNLVPPQRHKCRNMRRWLAVLKYVWLQCNATHLWYVRRQVTISLPANTAKETNDSVHVERCV